VGRVLLQDMEAGLLVAEAIAMDRLRQATEDTEDRLRLHAVILVVEEVGIVAVDDQEAAVLKEEDLDHVRGINFKHCAVNAAGASRFVVIIHLSIACVCETSLHLDKMGLINCLFMCATIFD
jgi:hypothetical protein